MAPVLEHPDTRWLESHAHAWVERGFVSHEQADEILRFEQVFAPSPGTPAEARMPPLAELFVYLGLIFATVGATFVVTRFWDELPWAARLAIGMAVAVLGLTAGRLLRRVPEPAFTRLAGVADLAGTGGVALTAGVAAVMLGSDDPGVTALVAGPAAALAGLVLWRNTDRPLQLLSVVAGLAATIAGLGDVLSLDAPAWVFTLVLVPTGAAIVALAARQHLRPPTTAMLVGGVLAVGGAYALDDVSMGVGALAAMLVAGCLVAVGLRTKRTPVTVIATLLFLQSMTVALGQYLRGAGAALGLLVAGFVIVVVALRRIRPGSF
jgi:hypothetical protein